jgi:REP element-mobilizing transposase RayT
VHVTLRSVRGLPSLRTARLFPALRQALAAASRAAFRVVHFSVQGNHVHLLVEVKGTWALARGMQGLGIRLAKAINQRLGRTGRVWAERYHGRPLRTPREVRHGLVCVLLNGRKHGVHGGGIDPCSSGAWFGGWRETIKVPRGPVPVARPRTWLLHVGWRRSGGIGLDEAPVGARRKSGRSG